MKSDDRYDASRRTFLSFMAGTSAALMAPEALLAEEGLDPRVAKILRKYAAVDMHNHAPVAILEEGEADPAKDPVFDLAGELKRGGFAALCYTYPVDMLRNPKQGGFYNAHLQALNQIDRMLARQHLQRALNLQQLTAAHKRDEPVIIQAAEGAQFLEGHLERLEESYQRGLRHLQLVHFADNPGFPLGEVQTTIEGEAPAATGLTEFGSKVVKECNRLHIVMDFAHAGLQMVKGALDISSDPFVVSHTALDTPNGRAKVKRFPLRLVSSEHAKAVADAGGIIGVWHNFATVKDYVVHIKELADVVGIDHVGVGTDTSVVRPPVPDRRPTNSEFPDQPAGFMYSVANEMLKQGFTPSEAGKVVGGNYCRVFGKVTGHSA